MAVAHDVLRTRFRGVLAPPNTTTVSRVRAITNAQTWRTCSWPKVSGQPGGPPSSEVPSSAMTATKTIAAQRSLHTRRSQRRETIPIWWPSARCATRAPPAKQARKLGSHMK